VRSALWPFGLVSLLVALGPLGMRPQRCAALLQKAWYKEAVQGWCRADT